VKELIRVGILGASGYMGGEVIRILLEHPEVKIEWMTSRGDRPVEYYHKNLYWYGS
jgi:N-acetyl-gamma-glutamylphosphate reductase